MSGVHLVSFPLTTIDLRPEHLSALERRFLWRATSRNLPERAIANIIAWERQGIVDLNSFFVVENKEPRRLTRGLHFRWAYRHIREACRIHLKALWETEE